MRWVVSVCAVLLLVVSPGWRERRHAERRLAALLARRQSPRRPGRPEGQATAAVPAAPDVTDSPNGMPKGREVARATQAPALIWSCPVPECLWASVHPMEHPCPFPLACVSGPGTGPTPLPQRRASGAATERSKAHPEEARPRPDAPPRAVLDQVLAGLQRLGTETVKSQETEVHNQENVPSIGTVCSESQTGGEFHV